MVQGAILDSKDFYAPIITPYEAQLAFTPGAQWSGDYRLDYESLLNEEPLLAVPGATDEPRFSLLDSRYHEETEKETLPSTSKALTCESSQDLSNNDNASKHLAEVYSILKYAV